MKKVSFLTGLLAIGLCGGCLEKPTNNPGTASTILYRHHFVGTAQLAHDTNAAKLPAILALPATRELTGEIVQKLSKTPEELWRKFLPAGVVTPPGLARPLLDDLVSAESYAEVRGPLNRGESVFAIELGDDRASLWRTNLETIFTSWKLGKTSPIGLGDGKGWEIKRPESPELIQFVRTGKWVLIGLGPERLTLLPRLLEQVGKSGRPVAAEPSVALDLEADFPRLGDWLPGIARYQVPPAHLTLRGKGDYLRTELGLVLSNPFPGTLEAWRIPTNIIRDPIISFTVARGTAPLVGKVKGISKLGLDSLPNQVCSWSPATVPADFFVSMPMANPSNLVWQIGPKIQDFTTDLIGFSLGGVTLISNRSELVWQGWPALIPSARPVRVGDTDYLLAGILPVGLPTNRAPAELFDQLKGRQDLVYYNWELTNEKLGHAKQLQQIWDMINHSKFAPTNAPAEKWLPAVRPLLGNTITEATLTTPKELSIVRKSDCGLTAFELATLTRWIESKGFPWSFDAPSPLPGWGGHAGTKSNAPPAKPSTPGPKK